MTIGEENQNN